MKALNLYYHYRECLNGILYIFTLLVGVDRVIIYQYKSPIGVLLLEFHNGTFTKLDITANSDILNKQPTT